MIGISVMRELNNIHELVLRLIYNNHEKSFISHWAKVAQIQTRETHHLDTFHAVSILIYLKTMHHKSLKFLAVKIYKFRNALSPPIMTSIFISRQRKTYNLRKFQEFSTSTKITVKLGAKSYGIHLW